MNIGKNMITGYLKLFAKHILKVPWTNITINVIIKKNDRFELSIYITKDILHALWFCHNTRTF